MTMKRYFVPKITIVLMLSIILLSGCGTVKKEVSTLDTDEIKNITNLETLDVTIDNCAEGTQHKTNFTTKERKFFLVYKSEAKVYFDLSDVKVVQNGNDITITLPAPKVECNVIQSSVSSDNLKVEPDEKINLGFNQNPISGPEMWDAVGDANDKLEKDLAQNSSLMNAAEDQAKTLITNHINQLGEAAGVTYNIKFVQKTE